MSEKPQDTAGCRPGGQVESGRGRRGLETALQAVQAGRVSLTWNICSLGLYMCRSGKVAWVTAKTWTTVFHELSNVAGTFRNLVFSFGVEAHLHQFGW